MRALAQAMRDSPEWPVGDDRSLETVANKLRDADKGKDVAWWSGPGNQLLPALAAALGEEDEGELVEQMQREAVLAGAAGTALWPFSMFRALRPIDLRTEAPFPGIPDEILELPRARTACLWWLAPSGAGKTLAGHWLEAQFGWQFRRVADWADLHLPAQGRLFVELTSNAEVSAGRLPSIPPGLKICIAAPYPPPGVSSTDERATGTAGANGTAGSRSPAQNDPGATPRVVRTAPPQRWAEAVLRWAAARVRAGGGFDAERLRTMIEQEGVIEVFQTPGDLIALLGLVDQVGLKRFEEAKDPRGWIRVWLDAMLNRSDRHALPGVAGLLGKRGPELLVQIEVERLRRGFAPALTEAEWTELVPRDLVPDLDRDHLLAVLDAQPGDAVARLRDMLSPDAASMVRSLRTAGVLTEDVPGRLAFRPMWIASALGGAAFDRLYEDAPDGLGTLLLFHDTSGVALSRLSDDVRNGRTEGIAACLAGAGAAEEVASPERMAALDGAFRAVGHAVLTGASVSPDLVRATWDAMMAHVYSPHASSPPVPVLRIAAQDRWRGATTSGGWCAAAFAISRVLHDAGRDVGRSPFNPWRGDPEGAAHDMCIEALGLAGQAFRIHDGVVEDPLQLASYRLGGELLDRRGVLTRHGVLLELQGPDVLVSLAAGAALEVGEHARRHLLELPFGLQPVDEACRRRQVPLDGVLAWCWRTWGAGLLPWPPLGWLHEHRSPVPAEQLQSIWSAAPADQLSDRFCRGVHDWPAVWQWFTEPVWRRWLDVWSDRAGRHDHAVDAFRWIPEALAVEALRDGRIDPWSHDVRRVLWERMPRRLVALIDELAATPVARAGRAGQVIADLVFFAPDEPCAALVERARSWCREPSRYPGVGDWVPRWLGHLVDHRAPAWRAAYALLAAVTATSAVPPRATEEPGEPR